MATPDPVVEEILSTLAESELRWLALVGRNAVDLLPDQLHPTAGQRIEAAHRQLHALSRAMLDPLKRELEALARLPGLAEELNVRPHIKLVIAVDEGRDRAVELISVRRRQALERFIQALDAAIGSAIQRVILREGPSSP